MREMRFMGSGEGTQKRVTAPARLKPIRKLTPRFLDHAGDVFNRLLKILSIILYMRCRALEI
jgi:hypothetical protein